MEGDAIEKAHPSYRTGNFNPLPPHGGRPVNAGYLQQVSYFNPLPPHGGRRNPSLRHFRRLGFQSTPSAWRETNFLRRPGNGQAISIHSLRMEGDVDMFQSRHDVPEFQSTPSAWRETHLYHQFLIGMIFQSTPSAWRETITAINLPSEGVFQSTPSAWRETGIALMMPMNKLFQSTPSAWRETCCIGMLIL